MLYLLFGFNLTLNKLTIPFTQGNYQAAFLQGFSGLGAFPTISQ
jgi:hypothetical protein